ncbi:MAG: branched-chain amino acid ABC transporter permease [candidate division NC10 bacterium]|nr:branched-chain amino acid ABC transporter permease [candidate division NC10 bacterium]
METILQVAISGLLVGGIYALISIGLTLIFGVTRIINFAHGELLMLAMYTTFWLFQLFSLDPYVALFFVTPLLFLVGLIIHWMVIQPILGAPPLMQIFATVGLSVALQNGALLLWKADYRTIRTAYSTAVVEVGGLFISVPRLVAFLVAMAMAVALFLFLKKTPLGKAIRATAQDRRAAMLMGVDVRRIYLLSFGIGTACVGVAGALLMPVYYTFPTVGTYFVLTAFVVVVLGGMGDMMGAFLGGLIIGLVEAFSGFLIATALKEAVYFTLFILVLLLKPSGLFGMGRGAEEVGLK